MSLKAVDVTRKTCGATAVFWPDDEACDAECIRPPHDGKIHEDGILGEWDAAELHTWVPEEAP